MMLRKKKFNYWKLWVRQWRKVSSVLTSAYSTRSNLVSFFLVRPVSIVSPSHYVNLARQRALEFNKAQESLLNPTKARGFFHDQFERESNTTAHYLGTGLEIWQQTKGEINAFISGSGTGGTIAGVGRRLKENSRQIGKEVLIVLADPEGSGLYHKVSTISLIKTRC